MTTTIIIAMWVVWAPLFVVSLLKDKPWPAFFLGVFGATVTAIRLARPKSWWARHFYDEAKLERSRERWWGPPRPEQDPPTVGWER